MAASDLTTVAYIYKRKYSDVKVAMLAMRDHPHFQEIAKKGGFTGTAFFYPITYGNPQGISNVFADAQSGAESSKGAQLQMSRKKKYAVITLDGESIAACPDMGAFVDLVRLETDGVITEMGDDLAFDLARDGTGARGRRSGALAGNVVTMTVADDARNFKVGMTVLASPNADGSAPRVGTTKVAGIDEDAGTVTLVNAGAIAAFAANDYLFRNGGTLCMEGMASLTPLTAPAPAENFRGIDRSVDTRRLAGVRINDVATTIEENLGLAAVKCSQAGGKQKKAWLNPINFWQVARRQNAKVEYSDGGGTANYGFQYITISTPAGTLQVVSDPDFPTNRGYGGNPDSEYIKHLRGLPHIVMDDGLKSLRQTTSDGIEARGRAWMNYAQSRPVDFSVIAI